MNCNSGISKFEENLGVDLETFCVEDEIARYREVMEEGKNWDIILRLYEKPNKTKSGLIISNLNDEYEQCVGLVVDISPAAYEDMRYKDTGKWCKLGQWIFFLRHAGSKFFIDNIPHWVIKEDAVVRPAKDPTRITRDRK